RSHRTVRPSVPTDALQRLVELLLLDPASDADPIEEVLAGSQLRLQRRLMAQVGELRVERMQILADILPAPRDLSSLRVRETTGRAQERRLARTVGAGELETLPSPDLKPYPAQHMMVAAPKVHVLALETEIGHDPWMLAKPVSVANSGAYHQPPPSPASTISSPVESPRTRCPGGEIGRRKGLERLSARREWGQIR